MNTIIDHQPLLTPHVLVQEFPNSPDAEKTVALARHVVDRIMRGLDDRLLVIVGPCSIHDPKAALEYANLLQEAQKVYRQEIFIVMRVYFEKPRTTMGWKGLIRDPFLDESYDINNGLRIARKLLLDLNTLGVPTATEFLDTIIPHYLQDLITWSAIGARTSSSQLHRELASGLAMPVGFKNTTDGNIKIAIDAVNVAAHSHHFISINQHGTPSIVRTPGNRSCHIILRGSQTGPNFEEKNILDAAELLKKQQLVAKLMVDCSHGNSSNGYQHQRKVAETLALQIQNGSEIIFGVMLESNLVAGKQTLQPGIPLNYGQSITDECISWIETNAILKLFSESIKLRRKQIS